MDDDVPPHIHARTNIITSDFRITFTATAISNHFMKMCNESQNNTENNTPTRQPLLERESSIYFKHICTVTFFDGDIQSIVPHFEERIQQMLDKNPWLGGTLGEGNKELEYPESIPVDAILHVLTEPVPNLNMTTDYGELQKACFLVSTDNNHLTNNGNEQLEIGNCPVSRFVLAPIDTNESSSSPGFVLIFYLSHVVADGFTYYEIFNMLSDTGDSSTLVRALSPVRKMDYENDHRPILHGRELLKFRKSFTMIKAVLTGKWSKPAARPLAYYVDEEKVAAAKENFAATASTEDIPFISTNDILTSHFGNACRPRYFMMAINYRPRCSILDSNDAGNYEEVVPLDVGSYTTPAGIRKSLTPNTDGAYNGLTLPLPGFWENCPLALMTSWAIKGTAPPFDLKSYGIKQRLHLPISFSYMPISKCPMDVGIVFRPVPSKLAVLYLAKEAGPDKLLMDGSILGESISKIIFPYMGSS